MDPVTITVRAVQGGWTVESVLLGAPLMFLSGGRAERQAQRLAEAVIRLGCDVRVAVHDKVDALIALIELPAAEAIAADAAVEPPGRRRHAAPPQPWESHRWLPRRAVAPFASANWRGLVTA
jgi:hypothetical protein